MARVLRHIITPLDEEHELVKSELAQSHDNVLHQIHFSEEELSTPVKTAFAIRQTCSNLPIYVGNEVVIITEDHHALIEMLAVCFLQRRFHECIKIVVKRRSGSYVIPYIVNLKPGEGDERESMVDYNYSVGGCSGNCSSCG